MKSNALLALTSTLLAIAVSTTPAAAQEAPPGNLAETWVVYVDMANQPAFEDAVKGFMALAKDLGEPHNWETYNNHTGDYDGAYIFRSCCFTWADLDQKAAWADDNPQLQEFWNTQAHPLVRSYAHHYSEVDFENSHWPVGTGDPAFVSVTNYQIKVGAWQAFNAAKSELSQIALNNGWAEAGHEWAWTSAVNGSASANLVIPESNFADMAAPDPSFFQFLTQQLGSAAAANAKFQALTDACTTISYEIYNHRPDLSSLE